MKKKRNGTLNLFDTHFGIWEEAEDHPDARRSTFWSGMMWVFSALRGHLYRRGWTLKPELSVDATIRKGFWTGHKGDLECFLECCGRHIRLEFFQNINISNPNGGRYDFDKFKRMPRTMRLQCWTEMTALLRWALLLGYRFDKKSFDHTDVDIDVTKPLGLEVRKAMDRKVGESDSPLDRFNRSWGSKSFKRDDSGWPEQSDHNAYGYLDRDKQRMNNGDVRYAWVDRRLARGRVYVNMNGMWTFLRDDGSWITNDTSGRFFSTDSPDKLPRRRPLTKKEQIDRLRNELSKATNASNWKRVEALGRVLDRVSAASS